MAGNPQWRIMQGRFGCSNSFISKIDPTVSTVSILPAARNHFAQFFRLSVKHFYQSFKLGSACVRNGVRFAFIFCAGYLKNDVEEWKLQNFLMGQAMLAIYKTRKTIDG